MGKIFLVSLMIFILIFVLPGCNKGNETVSDSTQTGGNDTKTVKEDNSNQPIIAENKLMRQLVFKNPNTMELGTTRRTAVSIENEKKAIMQLAVKFLESVSKNGLDMTLEEVNKSRDGKFGEYLLGPYFYFAILQKSKDVIWTIKAHGTSRDFIGVDIDTTQWQDLTEWKYFVEPITKVAAGETNNLWIENVYWKDPNWAGGEPVIFDAYERFYKIGNEEYLLHFCQFLYE